MHQLFSVIQGTHTHIHTPHRQQTHHTHTHHTDNKHTDTHTHHTLGIGIGYVVLLFHLLLIMNSTLIVDIQILGLRDHI